MSQSASERLRPVLQGQTVIPVIVIKDLDKAVPLARALVEGGLPAIEITLRTPQALDAIKRIAAEVPDAIVGAGTILNAKHFDQAAEAGSKFIVSPGQSKELFDRADRGDVPLLPGATSASEVMAALERGYDLLKFFPAEQAGGAPFLKSLSSPFAGVSFCPTGGVSPGNATSYLSLPNVICVGGSWIAPDNLVSEGAWDKIVELAREAAKISRI